MKEPLVAALLIIALKVCSGISAHPTADYSPEEIYLVDETTEYSQPPTEYSRAQMDSSTNAEVPDHLQPRFLRREELYGDRQSRSSQEKEVPRAYEFGYDINDMKHGSQFRHEAKDKEGNVQGRFGYQDDKGQYRQVHYVADDHGFRANVITNEAGIASQQPAAVNIMKDNHNHNHNHNTARQFPDEPKSERFVHSEAVKDRNVQHYSPQTVEEDVQSQESNKHVSNPQLYDKYRTNNAPSQSQSGHNSGSKLIVQNKYSQSIDSSSYHNVEKTTGISPAYQQQSSPGPSNKNNQFFIPGLSLDELQRQLQGAYSNAKNNLQSGLAQVIVVDPSPYVFSGQNLGRFFGQDDNHRDPEVKVEVDNNHHVNTNHQQTYKLKENCKENHEIQKKSVEHPYYYLTTDRLPSKHYYPTPEKNVQVKLHLNLDEQKEYRGQESLNDDDEVLYDVYNKDHLYKLEHEDESDEEAHQVGKDHTYEQQRQKKDNKRVTEIKLLNHDHTVGILFPEGNSRYSFTPGKLLQELLRDQLRNVHYEEATEDVNTKDEHTDEIETVLDDDEDQVDEVDSVVIPYLNKYYEVTQGGGENLPYSPEKYQEAMLELDTEAFKALSKGGSLNGRHLVALPILKAVTDDDGKNLRLIGADFESVKSDKKHILSHLPRGIIHIPVPEHVNPTENRQSATENYKLLEMGYFERKPGPNGSQRLNVYNGNAHFAANVRSYPQELYRKVNPSTLRRDHSKTKWIPITPLWNLMRNNKVIYGNLKNVEGRIEITRQDLADLEGPILTALKRGGNSASLSFHQNENILPSESTSVQSTESLPHH